MVLLVFVGLFIFTATDEPVSEVEKNLVVTFHDLEPYFDDLKYNTEYESFKKVRYFDRSTDVTYEYSHPAEDQPYISVTITHEPKKSDALTSYAIGWSSGIAGMNIVDSEWNIEEDNTIFKCGEKSRFGVVKYGDVQIGNMLSLLVGNNIYDFFVSGLILDDPEILAELFNEKAKTLKTYK